MKIEDCSEPAEIKFEDIIRKAITSSGPANSAKGINAELVYLTDENGGVFTDEVLCKVPTVKNGKGISRTKVWIVTFSGIEIHPGNGPAGVKSPGLVNKIVNLIRGKDVGSLNLVYDATTGLFLTGFASR